MKQNPLSKIVASPRPAVYTENTRLSCDYHRHMGSLRFITPNCNSPINNGGKKPTILFEQKDNLIQFKFNHYENSHHAKNEGNFLNPIVCTQN